MCNSHYHKARWASGHRAPSVNAAARRRTHLKSRYGLTDEEVDILIAEQHGTCAVCGEPPSSKNTRAHWNGKLCVDHDHETGEVRGLLCFTCNVGLGNFGDDVERLRRGARYLERTLTAPSRIAEGVYDVAGIGWRRVPQTAEDVAADG